MKWGISLFVVVLALWVLLTGLTLQEFFTGVIVSVLVTAVGIYVYKDRGFNPGYFLAFIPLYIYQEIVSHLDVIYRIITGRINPGIVSVPNKLNTDFGTTALANSITMTPGTLTLEADKSRFFIHWLSVRPDKRVIPGRFEGLLKKAWG